MRKLLTIFLSISIISGFSQEMRIAGSVFDTISKVPLKNAIAMVVRLNDSVLITHARTNENGRFEFKNLKIDTVQVIITEPRFGGQSFYVFASKTNFEFDFGKVILPPKSQELNEVVIYAYKDPVYYKGDTLIYAADSFKVRPNATVEDLLRRLPGMKVDSEGKITSQGKEIKQVLVDGDEFFGTDPTIATKNLTAQGVESVQVYEKKNEDAAEGGDDMIQVMNLKMKEDAKKGYFGKVSAASDFQNFHEGEMLANRFNGSQKISFFALASNTPRASFGWRDMYKYGINEDGGSEDEDGNWTWTGGGQENKGIPKTFKTGFYYNDKLSKKTKLNLNYTYNNNQLLAKTSSRSQYFLADTSYVTENELEDNQKTESHVINLKINQTIDSLTELEIRPKLQLNAFNTNAFSLNYFKTSTDTTTRLNDVENTNNAKGVDFNTDIKLIRKFKKKDRLLLFYYTYNNKEDKAEGFLKSNNTFYSGAYLPNDSTNQKKESSNTIQLNNARIVYTEPLSKKSKLEFSYLVNSFTSNQDKKTFNYFNGDYSVNDSNFSNNFENITLLNKAGIKYIFDNKTTNFYFGIRAQDNQLTNKNFIDNAIIKYNTKALLPFLTYRYKFSDNSRYNFTYTTNSNQPSINQLQPVLDNTNPNRIIIGNPNLKPTYNNKFEMTYNFHKPISGRYLWSNVNFSFINNAFGNSATFDSIGRTVTQTINVDGNYYGGFYFGGGIPLFSKVLQLYPNINGGINKNTNYVNTQKNITESSNISTGLDIAVQTDSMEFSLGASFNWNQTHSTLNAISNKPYGSQSFNAGIAWLLPYKFILESSLEYTVNSQRTDGYNINFLIWDAKVSKAFLKNENLIFTFEANDIFNQNINTNRFTSGNIITDTKTNIISRYILVRLTYKFNSTKTKDSDDDW